MKRKYPGNYKRMIDKMCEPARRHRCEECSSIFECHLCTIHHQHFIHWERALMERRPLYVCEACIKKQKLFTVTTARHYKNKICRVLIYDHLTGALLKDRKHRSGKRGGSPMRRLNSEGEYEHTTREKKQERSA